MKCPKCGKELKEGTKFCVGCGTKLTNVEESVKKEVVNEEKVKEIKEKVNQKVETVKEQAKKAADSDFMKIVLATLMFLVNILLKPIKTLKAKLDYYSEPKNGFILAGVVALVTMVIRVFISFVMALIKKNCITSWTGTKTCSTIGENLKNIPWMDITLKHLLVILMAMFIIAGIYYIASLIVKKNTNYMRLISIVAVSFIPACAAMYVLSPIFGWINVHLGVVVSIIGYVYSLVVFFTAMKDEIKFKDADTCVYFNLICASIILIGVYFLGVAIVNNAANDVTNNILGSISLK